MSQVHLYDVVVGHTRHQLPTRSFQHRLYTWLVDLDSPTAMPRWIRPLARFEARDHLGDPGRRIRGNLDRWLAAQGIDLAGGQILMLANARVLGHVFNPITVYWCHRPDGDLECVVAEVHNTYRERHCYLLFPDADGTTAVDKRFFVSPFLPADGHYRMRLPEPDARLSLRIDLVRDGRSLLTATLTGHRLPATPWHLLRLVLRRSLVPHRVSMLIRRHGIALWLRGTPLVPRRPHVHQEGVR